MDAAIAADVAAPALVRHEPHSIFERAQQLGVKLIPSPACAPGSELYRKELRRVQKANQLAVSRAENRARQRLAEQTSNFDP